MTIWEVIFGASTTVGGVVATVSSVKHKKARSRQADAEARAADAEAALKHAETEGVTARTWRELVDQLNAQRKLTDERFDRLQKQNDHQEREISRLCREHEACEERGREQLVQLKSQAEEIKELKGRVAFLERPTETNGLKHA